MRPVPGAAVWVLTALPSQCPVPFMRRIALGLLALAGCSDPAPGPADASHDAAADIAADVAQDAPRDAGTDVGPPTAAPEAAPEALPLPRWLVAHVRDGTPDPVRVPLERGTLTMPAEGPEGDLDWVVGAPTEEGDLPAAPPRATGYAVTTFEAPAGRRCFAQADRVLSLSINGAMQPGDVYGSGRIRVPLVTRPGDNLLVARSIGGRGAPRVRVWCTPHELHLNADDLTPPDFVVGQTGERWLGAAVLALTDAPALDLVARVEASDQFEATEVRYPALAGGAVTQVGWRLTPRRAFDQPAEAVRVTLRLESPSLRYYYRHEVNVAVVAAGVAYRHTRRSRVDGSVQYHAVLPPAGFDPARRYAMVLSLHGAGVEAIGQARAYAAKDWAYIVAPTNRRPFGFDWEVWGRLDGLEALDDATAALNTDPERVYVTGQINNSPVLYRSDDGGATVREITRSFDGGYDAFLSAVDPRNPDVVYVRVSLGLETRLLRSDDGGARFTRIQLTRSPMLGFALSDDGNTVWTASADEGLQRSVGGAPFAPTMSRIRARCLRYASGSLYACGDSRADGFALARSDDQGDRFDVLLRLPMLPGAVACSPGTEGAACAAEWPAMSQFLREQLDAGAPLDAVVARDTGPAQDTPTPRDLGDEAIPPRDAPVDAKPSDASMNSMKTNA